MVVVAILVVELAATVVVVVEAAGVVVVVAAVSPLQAADKATIAVIARPYRSGLITALTLDEERLPFALG